MIEGQFSCDRPLNRTNAGALPPDAMDYRSGNWANGLLGRCEFSRTTGTATGERVEQHHADRLDQVAF